MSAHIVFRVAYLHFPFELSGVQQGHFEGGHFESFGAFLWGFEVFVWGRLVRRVVCFSVFVGLLGVLFLHNTLQKKVIRHSVHIYHLSNLRESKH